MDAPSSFYCRMPKNGRAPKLDKVKKRSLGQQTGSKPGQSKSRKRPNPNTASGKGPSSNTSLVSQSGDSNSLVSSTLANIIATSIKNDPNVGAKLLQELNITDSNDQSQESQNSWATRTKGQQKSKCSNDDLLEQSRKRKQVKISQPDSSDISSDNDSDNDIADSVYDNNSGDQLSTT